MALHLGWFLHAHKRQYSWCNIGQDTVLNLRYAIRYYNNRYRIQRVSSVWCAILVDCVVGITVVSDDYNLVAVSLCRSYNLLYALIHSLNSLLDSLVDTCVAYHIAICEVQADEVVLLLVQCANQLIRHLVCAHLWLQVVCSNLW